MLLTSLWVNPHIWPWICDVHHDIFEAGWRIYVPLKRVIVGSGNGLSPVRRQAITRTNGELLPIGPLGTKFNEILVAGNVYYIYFPKEQRYVRWRELWMMVNQLWQIIGLLFSEWHTVKFEIFRVIECEIY